MMNSGGLPGVAEVAMQAGLYAARRIRRELAGQPPGKPFRYRDLGSAAYVSRGNAVVSVGRLHLDGFLGWWAWLVIHIGFMTGFRNRFGALASWWFAFTRDLRRERTFTSRDVGVLRDVYGDQAAAAYFRNEDRRPAGPRRPAGAPHARRSRGETRSPGAGREPAPLSWLRRASRAASRSPPGGRRR